MPIPVFSVQDCDGLRHICVIAGQPYYQSTGENSSMRGIWLPFDGFELPMSRSIPLYGKPNATHDADNRPENYFPIPVAIVLNDWAEQIKSEDEEPYLYWGRFKNTKGIYTSCLLSQLDLIPAPVQLAVMNTVLQRLQSYTMDTEVKLEPNEAFKLASSVVTIVLPLNNRDILQDDVDDLNMILTSMGATPDNMPIPRGSAPNEIEDNPLDFPVTYIQNTIVDNANFNSDELDAMLPPATWSGTLSIRAEAIHTRRRSAPMDVTSATPQEVPPAWAFVQTARDYLCGCRRRATSQQDDTQAKPGKDNDDTPNPMI